MHVPYQDDVHVYWKHGLDCLIMTITKKYNKYLTFTKTLACLAVACRCYH